MSDPTSETDIRSFEREIVVRPLRASDFNAVVELQIQCFPGMKPWQPEQFQSQLERFPDGQLCVEHDGSVIASSSSLIVDFALHSEWHDWKRITDDGFIRNHAADGDTLYGIEIMVSPQYRGMRLARRLYSARKQLAKELNLARIIIGGRLPGYGAHADAISVQQYVDKVIEKELVDPVLTPQLSNRFALKGIIPGYFPADQESRGYATHLEWTNLDHVPSVNRRLTVVAPIRLAVVQYGMRPVESFEDFARHVKFFVDVASDYRADFLLFPELFTVQLLSLVKATRPGQAARELAKYTPQYLELFTALALKYDVNIVGGSTFTIEDDHLYNVAYLFRRNGTIERQFKLHVTPNEARWWGVSPGRKAEVFDTDRGRIAIQVCYDVEFPELGRIAAADGADLILVPFNTDTRHGYLRVRCCAQARAIENQLYVAISGCVGNLPDVENADVHYAQSGIFTPSDFAFSRDAVAAECQPNNETVILQDLDLELLRRSRRTGTVRPWSDRRRDLYRVTYEADGGPRDV